MLVIALRRLVKNCVCILVNKVQIKRKEEQVKSKKINDPGNALIFLRSGSALIFHKMDFVDFLQLK